MERTNSFNWILKMQSNEHIGVWVTKDGYIRHEFLPNGRYTEARGNEKSAYTGFYAIRGKHVEYLDDTGFTAEGDFIDGVYFHAGTMLYKETA